MNHARICLSEEGRRLRAALYQAEADPQLRNRAGRRLIVQMRRDLADVEAARELIALDGARGMVLAREYAGVVHG